MSSEWREHSLLDIYDVTNGLNKGRKEFGFGYPFLTFKEVFYNYFVPEELTSLANTNTKERHKCSVRTGDVFITRTSETFDELGMSCVAIKDYPDASFNGFCKRLRPNGLIEIDAEYSAFFFNSPGFRKQILSLANMSTRASLNNDMLKSLTVKLPPLDVQQSIAKVLVDLHDKIQLNHQINQTLEQMAQAIFKSWFVDFEPVKAKIAALEAGGSEEDALLAAMQAISRTSLFDADASAAGAGKQLARLQAEHPEQYAKLRATAELFPSAMQDSELGEIPEGWKVGHLRDLLHFNPRRSLKKGTIAPYLDMKNVPTSGHIADEVVDREMGSGTKFINGDILLARITPCLENGKTAYVDFLDEGQVGWGSTEYIVIRPQNEYPESLGYLIARNSEFRQHAIQSMTGTSGRQRANAKALEELPWLIYPTRVVCAFDKLGGGYLKLAKSYGNESKNLSQLRDTLLPKLLSGELSVSAVETYLAEAKEAANV
jgi:type I restriction enzyme S subunit